MNGSRRPEYGPAAGSRQRLEPKVLEPKWLEHGPRPSPESGPTRDLREGPHGGGPPAHGWGCTGVHRGVSLTHHPAGPLGLLKSLLPLFQLLLDQIGVGAQAVLDLADAHVGVQQELVDDLACTLQGLGAS